MGYFSTTENANNTKNRRIRKFIKNDRKHYLRSKKKQYSCICLPKKRKFIFLNIEDALSSEKDLKAKGWRHIHKVDPSIILTKIFDICNEDFESSEKIDDIIGVFAE